MKVDCRQRASWKHIAKEQIQDIAAFAGLSAARSLACTSRAMRDVITKEVFQDHLSVFSFFKANRARLFVHQPAFLHSPTMRQLIPLLPLHEMAHKDILWAGLMPNAFQEVRSPMIYGKLIQQRSAPFIAIKTQINEKSPSYLKTGENYEMIYREGDELLCYTYPHRWDPIQGELLPFDRHYTLFRYGTPLDDPIHTTSFRVVERVAALLRRERVGYVDISFKRGPGGGDLYRRSDCDPSKPSPLQLFRFDPVSRPQEEKKN